MEKMLWNPNLSAHTVGVTSLATFPQEAPVWADEVTGLLGQEGLTGLREAGQDGEKVSQRCGPSEADPSWELQSGKSTLCIRAHGRTLLHTHVHKLLHTHSCAHIAVCAHTPACAHMCNASALAHMCTHACIQSCMHTHAYICACTHRYTRSCMHTHVHVCTYTQAHGSNTSTKIAYPYHTSPTYNAWSRGFSDFAGSRKPSFPPTL